MAAVLQRASVGLYRESMEVEIRLTVEEQRLLRLNAPAERSGILWHIGQLEFSPVSQGRTRHA